MLRRNFVQVSSLRMQSMLIFHSLSNSRKSLNRSGTEFRFVTHVDLSKFVKLAIYKKCLLAASSVVSQAEIDGV